MSGLEVLLDPGTLGAMRRRFAEAGKNGPAALARAINHTGDKARTQMVRSLTTQTGLKRQVIVRALKVTRASAGGLAYRISSKGGNVHLKYFGARETRSGVSAAPWGHRTVYGGTFIKGGRFPNRVSIGKGGQVFVRTGGGRLPIKDVRSGLYIPAEMVKGETEAAFFRVAEAELPGRLMHELDRLLP